MTDIADTGRIFTKTDRSELQTEWLHIRQLETVRRSLPLALRASLGNAFLIVIFCLNDTSRQSILFWSIIMAGAAIAAAMLADLVNGGRRAATRTQYRLRNAVIAALVVGTAWGIGPLLLFPVVSSTEVGLISTVCAVVLCGGAYSLSVLPRAAAAFIVSMTVGYLIALSQMPSGVSWQLSLAIGLYSGLLVRAAYGYHGSFVSTWREQREAGDRSMAVADLLRDFEAAGSEKLWEVGRDQSLRTPSSDLAALLGYTTEQLETMRLIDLFDEAVEVDAVRELARTLAGREPFQNLAAPMLVGGEPRWFSLSGRPLETGGRFSGYRGVIADITELRRARAQADYLKNRDELTGLINRKQLMAQLDELTCKPDPLHPGISITLVSVDFFKSKNEQYGHVLADQMLAEIGKRLAARCDNRTRAARFGGDEFAVVSTRRKTLDAASDDARHILNLLRAPMTVGEERVSLSISIGLAFSADPETDVHRLLGQAELALSRAKTDMRGSVCLYEADMDEAGRRRQQMEHDLSQAVARQQLQLYFQPIVDAKTGRISSLEALLRWQHPTFGEVQPHDFIPLAEQTGQILPIGDWVIREALTEAALWTDELSVSINLSPAQLRTPQIVSTIVQALGASGVAPARLEIEITESALLDESSQPLTVLDSLRDLGVKIVLDDFGTGYSSLSYLHKFAVDKLKIDKSFVVSMDENNDARTIVRAIADLANMLGIETTAEGVETATQREQLDSDGCRRLQGFLFSRPQPPEELHRRGLLERGTAETRDTDTVASLSSENEDQAVAVRREA